MVERSHGGRIGKRNHDPGAIDAEMLIGEVSGRIPGTELVDAGQSCGVLGLIHGILQLAHPQRAAAEAERRAVLVALLRVIIAIGPCRIAGKHGGEHREIIRRFDLHTDSRSSQRIGRATVEHVGGQHGRPTKGSVDQAASRVASEEFIVGGELPDPDRNPIVVQILLKPSGKQSRGCQCVDIAGIGNGANLVCDIVPAIVDLEYSDVRASSPVSVQVGIDRDLKPALETGSPVDATRQQIKGLCDLVERDVDTLVLQRGSSAIPIAGQRVPLPDGLRLGLILSVRATNAEAGRHPHGQRRASDKQRASQSACLQQGHH